MSTTKRKEELHDFLVRINTLEDIRETLANEINKAANEPHSGEGFIAGMEEVDDLLKRKAISIRRTYNKQKKSEEAQRRASEAKWVAFGRIAEAHF